MYMDTSFMMCWREESWGEIVGHSIGMPRAGHPMSISWSAIHCFGVRGEAVPMKGATRLHTASPRTPKQWHGSTTLTDEAGPTDSEGRIAILCMSFEDSRRATQPSRFALAYASGWCAAVRSLPEKAMNHPRLRLMNRTFATYRTFSMFSFLILE